MQSVWNLAYRNEKNIEAMGYVYLICDPSNDTFKIGVTKKLDIEERMKKLQTGNSTELFIRSFYKCEYPFRLEKLLHTRFQNKRQHGEWFLLDCCEVNEFKNICKELEIIIDSLKDNPYIKLT